MNYYQQPFFYGPGVGQPQPVYQQPYAQPVPVYPEPVTSLPSFVPPPTSPSVATEQSYIENILRLNIGKVATVYMNFENSQWGSKIFKGTILAAGKDHLILKDPNSEMRFLLLTVYLNYITFDEEIDYEYPFRKKK